MLRNRVRNFEWHEYSWIKKRRKIAITRNWWFSSYMNKILESQADNASRRTKFGDQFDYPLVIGIWYGKAWWLQLAWDYKRLKQFGFEFHRQTAGSHEIWYSSTSIRYATVPNHTGEMPEGTLSAILMQANITPEEFHKCYLNIPIPLVSHYAGLGEPHFFVFWTRFRNLEAENPERGCGQPYR
jgi:predicted RNA binding protein YcfA (HicA-like mRNA interferase family)